MSESNIAERVLVYSSVHGADHAQRAVTILGGAGLGVKTCTSEDELRRELQRGAGLVVLPRDASHNESEVGQVLASAVQDQPSWSVLPVLVLTNGEPANPPLHMPNQSSARADWVVHVKLPLCEIAFLSTVKAALAARRTQYALRDAELEKAKCRATAQQQEAILNAMTDVFRDGLAIELNECPPPEFEPQSVVGNGSCISSERLAVLPDARSLHLLHHRDRRPATEAELPTQRAIRSGVTVHDEEWLLQRDDESVVPIICSAGPIRAADGTTIGALLAWRDISHRYQAEKALNDSEERLNIALQSGSMGAWEWQIESNKVIWSPTLEQIHGLTPGSFERTFDEFQAEIHPQDRALVMDAIRATIEEHEDYHVEYRIIRKDKTVAWLEARGRLFFDADGKPDRMMGVCADITDRKLVEDELARHRDHLAELVNERTRALEASHHRLRHSERMAAMGTLSAGLGHDLGNLVFPLRIRLDQMRSRTKLPAGLRDELEAVHQAVDYLQRLANGLRHMAMDPSEVGIGVGRSDLHDWWADVEPVLSNAVPSGVSLERRFPTELPMPAVAPHGLTQAVFNLVQNASEAMADRQSGRIVIDAEVGEGETVKLRVSDNGPGMKPEVRERCLEPFFTTKVRGISTGIGLALVHGVVSRVGGTIELDSEPGCGTTWTLTFPTANGHGKSIGSAEGRSAVVTIADPRMSAFVIAVLRSLDLDANAADEPENTNTVVWVLDFIDDMQPVLQFLAADDARRVVLLEPPSTAVEHPQILQVQSNATSESLRRALRNLVEGHRALQSEACL